MPSPYAPTSAVTRTPAVGTPARPSCQEQAGLFLDPLLEEPPTASAPASERLRYASLARQAEQLCQRCPVLQACLYRAVVEHDVAGFVAGTSARQRLAIRRRLGVTVKPEDFDVLAGVARKHRQVNHDEVARVRRANPTESLEQLAHRLGCSLSTVKRHLRRDRNTTVVAREEGVDPSSVALWAAFRDLTRARKSGTDLAA